MAVFLTELEAPRAGSRQGRGKGVSRVKMNDLNRALKRRVTVSTNFFQMSRVALFSLLFKIMIVQSSLN